MIKKLLYLFSFIMIGYSLMVIRLRPANLFQKARAPESISIEEEVLDQAMDPKPVQRTHKIEIDNIIVDHIIGEVSISRHNNSEALEVGRVLRYDDVIKTSKGSVAILKFANNSIIKIFSNTVFEITLIQSKQRTSDNLQYNIFNLAQGAVLVDFVNYKRGHFLEITSKAAKVQVKGTQFLFLHNQNKLRSQLAVREGVVKVTPKGLLSTRYIKTSQGTIIKPATEINSQLNNSWVKKVNWNKLAKGSGINLFNPNATKQELAHWERSRKKMQGLYFPESTPRKVKNKPSKGFLRNALNKATQVSKKLGKIAKKGAANLKTANPSATVQDSQQQIQNFEQGQKDRMKALDNLEKE